MSDHPIKPLAPDTWDAFARLAERHNGVFGGCWCTWFHTLHAAKTFAEEGNRALKQRLVNEGRAHAAPRGSRTSPPPRPKHCSPRSAHAMSSGSPDAGSPPS